MIQKWSNNKTHCIITNDPQNQIQPNQAFQITIILNINYCFGTSSIEFVEDGIQ